MEFVWLLSLKLKIKKYFQRVTPGRRPDAGLTLFSAIDKGNGGHYTPVIIRNRRWVKWQVFLTSYRTHC